MFLRSSISCPLQHLSFSSTSFCSQTQLGFYRLVFIPINRNRNISITCTFSQVHNYGTVDYEKKPALKWKDLYKKICVKNDASLSCSTILNGWELDGKRLTKWELCRCVKEFRKHRRFGLALEVYEWMNDQGDRFILSSSDIAIQLDLISKVHGNSRAEEYFLKLRGSSKDIRTYGALLNAYCKAKMREKAESLFEKMIDRGYANHPLPYNVMATLYMRLEEYDKAISLITEMLIKHIQLDLYTYNIWLTICGALGSTEKIEQVVERMKLDATINPNWTTYSTMASMYIKLGQTEEAKDCLKKVENRITGRDQIPYHYLLTLYSSLGQKEDVYRIWSTYKSIFPKIWNLGYKIMIAALLKIDDIEEAEKIYEEWLLVRQTYDPRVCNHLMGWYVSKGLLEKAESFLEKVFEVGGKVNSNTWAIVAEGHIKKKQISKALSCMKEATTAEGADSWRPNPTTVSTFISVCEQESDLESRDLFLELLRKVCYSISKDRDSDDDDGTNMLLNEIQESL